MFNSVAIDERPIEEIFSLSANVLVWIASLSMRFSINF